MARNEKPPLVVRYNGVDYLRTDPPPSESEPARAVEVLDAHAYRALEFYADPKSWDYIDPERGTVTTSYPATRDRGERARAALRGK